MNYVRHADFEEIEAPAFCMTLLDQSGDTTITWSEPDDVDVLTFIQQKIDEGYVFFIEQPRVLRAFMKKKKIDSVSEVKERKLIVADERAAELELKGKIKLVTLKSETKEPAPVKKAKDAKEVAKSRSIATKPVRGG